MTKSAREFIQYAVISHIIMGGGIIGGIPKSQLIAFVTFMSVVLGIWAIFLLTRDE